MSLMDRCGFVTIAPLAEVCGASLRLWRVFTVTGSGTKIEEPLIRCTNHLAPTIASLTDDENYLGLRDIERVGRVIQ